MIAIAFVILIGCGSIYLLRREAKWEETYRDFEEEK
jgi:hypothetical protein